MKLKSLNKNIKKYGFHEEIEYTNATFNGHQLGIAICIKNQKTGEIEQNFLSQELGDDKIRDSLLKELLADKSILLMENNITQFNESKTEIVPKTIYYLPYYVDGHSVMQPTVNYENVSKTNNTSYDIKVEVLFVEDELNRYITIPIKTKNTSIMNLVYDLFGNYDDEFLETLGIKWQDEDENIDVGYVLDFYNQVGEKYNLIFEDIEDLRNAIVSMRLIDIKSHIDEGEENGDESK